MILLVFLHIKCDLTSLFTVLFRLAEKELQRKSLEDSLNAERSSGASRETNMQVCFTREPHLQLRLDLQTYSARLERYLKCTLFPLCVKPSEQNTSRLLIFQAMHNENMSLKAENQNLQAQITDQVSSKSSFFYMCKHV